MGFRMQRSRLFLKAAALTAAIAALGCQHHATTAASGSRWPAAAALSLARGSPPSHIPSHVQTAEYLWTPTERRTDPRLYAPYLTWAYPLYVKAQAVQDAGIKTIFYVNPVMPQQGEYEYGLLSGKYAAVRAKDCSGNIVTTYKGRGLLADPREPQTPAFYADVIEWYIRSKIRPPGSTARWDAFMIDNNGALYGAQPLPCNYDPKIWGRAFDAAIARIHEPIVTNSLAAPETAAATYVDRLSAPNIIGGVFEECFNNGMWTAEEQSQIETLALFRRIHKRAGPNWWCYVNNTSEPSAQSLPQRIFAYASFLLTYDVNHSLFQESFTTQPSTFKVYPETGFVPLAPARTVRDVNDLRADSGAYIQLYAWCYMRTSPLGPCEIAVNPSSATVSVPNPLHLTHSMVIAGGGVLDGGTVRFDGAVAPSLAPQTAEILVK